MTFSSVAASSWWRAMVASLCAFCVSLLLIAPASADPAGRVGRLSWFSGSVTVQSPDSEDTTALLNWPLTNGHRLIVGPEARAEVQIGSTMLQIASRSVVDFVQVDDERVRLQLLDGSMTARLYSPETVHEFEIVTREGGFQPLTAGFFRVDVDRSSSAVTVYSGRLRFMAFDQTVNVETGQRAQLWHDGRTQHRFLLPENDEFSRWAAVRDQQYGNPLQARYVPAEMTGASHLDAYGRWYDSPEYGAVWFPQTVAADWAPYRNGRWAWVAPWGWTWIGVEPWGFAPFHYGRWVFYRNAWGWVPGQRVHRPVYAPALVAWVGSPGSGVAPVGWFPLAPREVFRPAYQSSEHYLRALNDPHAPRNFNYRALLANPQAVENARYAHYGQARAMTLVPAETVLHRRQVGETIIPERDRRQWASQPVQFQAPVAAPHVDRREMDRREMDRREADRREADRREADRREADRREADRRENDRRQEAERRVATERRLEGERRREAERAQELGAQRPRENGTALPPGTARDPRFDRPVDSTPAMRPVVDRSDRQTVRGAPAANVQTAPISGTVPPVPSARTPAGASVSDRPAQEAVRPAPPLRPETVRPPVGGTVADRPLPEAVRPVPPPRPERVEARPAPAAASVPPSPPVPQRFERPGGDNRSSERSLRRDDAAGRGQVPPRRVARGRPDAGFDRTRTQSSPPAPVAHPPVSAPAPAERPNRAEAATDPRGGRDRRDDRRGPGTPDRP
ncbi:MAG TPA: hypothetical protein PLT57_04145 [Accumulibacter sp.]|nr:hypothetical protein [Accumulibacter sp.]